MGSSALSTGRDDEDLKGRTFDFRTYKGGCVRPYVAKRGNILEICNHFIPYINSVWEKTVLVSRSFAIYFVKVILISNSIHGCTKWW